jgi:predicted DNA-binding protein
MASTKVTFSLDDETISCLEQTAERLRRAKSQVVREAIHEYAARADRLSEAERLQMLRTLAQALARIPARSAKEVDRELAALRKVRRSAGRGGAAR